MVRELLSLRTRVSHMTRLARASALVLLVFTFIGSSGCIHTWTGTYAEYPESIYGSPHNSSQGNPTDG
jgi:hypothetical protein